jgi:hypothetical protein
MVALFEPLKMLSFVHLFNEHLLKQIQRFEAILLNFVFFTCVLFIF